MPGDDVAIFILAPKCPEEHPGMTCYPNDRYEPIGFPIFAEYDDDMRVRNVREINEYMNRYLHEFATVYEKQGSVMVNDEELPNFVEYEWSDTEDFVRDVAHGQLWVNCIDGKKRRLEHVMVHTGLYNMLLQNISSRIPYGKTESYEALMYAKVIKVMEWLKKDDELTIKMKLKHGIDVPSLRRFSDKIHVDSFSYWNSMDKMAKYYLETEDGCVLDDIVRYIMWATIMNYSRYGYHCISGGGSQCQEMMLQKIIAEFVIEKCNERELEAKEDRVEDEVGDEIDVLSETLYFWDD
jgi:hypothetical protein